jgi:hypothetical protein
LREAADPNNPLWARGLLYLLTVPASPLAFAEELSRGVVNQVVNLGIGGGEHVGRAYQWASQGEYGEAIEELLFGVASESFGFVIAGQALEPFAAGSPPPPIKPPPDLPMPPIDPPGVPPPSTEASALFQARDEAAQTARKIVEQEMREGRFSGATSPADLQSRVQRRFGTWLDALAKSSVRQAVVEGRLPNTFVTSPTVGISRGYLQAWISAPDVWDTATGRAWDFMAASESEFYKHENLYLGTTAFGRLDPAGTTITEMLPLFHLGF